MPYRELEKRANEIYFEKREEVALAIKNASEEDRKIVLESIKSAFKSPKPEKIINTIVNGLWLMEPPLTKVDIAKELNIVPNAVAAHERKIVRALTTRLDVLSGKNK